MARNSKRMKAAYDGIDREKLYSVPEAVEMLASLRIDGLLRGARGKPAVDRTALIDAIVVLSRIAWALREEVAEIDINPVIARDTGTTAVDALIVRRT